MKNKTKKKCEFSLSPQRENPFKIKQIDKDDYSRRKSQNISLENFTINDDSENMKNDTVQMRNSNIDINIKKKSSNEISLSKIYKNENETPHEFLRKDSSGSIKDLELIKNKLQINNLLAEKEKDPIKKKLLHHYTLKPTTSKKTKNKKKYSIIEDFLKNTQKNIEEEEKLFNENLPFRKKSPRSFSSSKDVSFEKPENEFDDNKISFKNPNNSSSGKKNKDDVIIQSLSIENENNESFSPNSRVNVIKNSSYEPSDKQNDSDENKSRTTKKPLPKKELEESRNLYKFNNVYESFSDEEIQEELNQKESNYFIIGHSTKQFWDDIIIIMIFYSAVTTPYSIAFSSQSHGFLFFNEIVLDFIFLTDILLNFFSAYKDTNDYIVVDHTKIAENYLKGWLIVDLLSLFPFNFFLFLSDLNKTNQEYENNYHYPFNSMLEITSSFCVFRWIKVTRLFKLLKYDNYSELKFMSNSKLNRVIKSACIFIILIHYSSCFFIYLGLIHYDPTKNWIYVTELCETCNADIYIASIYFNLVTIFSIGYGDITCQNNIEMSYNIFLLLIGVLLFSFAISSLSSLFSNIDNKTAIYTKKLNLLDTINFENNLSERLYKTLKRYITIEYNRNNNDRYELLDSLPTNIKNELTFYMYRVLIKNQKFFKDQSHDFILYVLPFLKSHKIHKNEILFSVGEFVEEAYLVVKGCLAMNLGPLYENLEIGVVRENSYFGDLLMNANEQSPYELKCKSKLSEVLVLKKSDFMKIKNAFNENVIKILRESYKTLEIVDKRRQQFLQLYFYENSVFGVKSIMKDLNIYLMKKGFNNYYYHNTDFENANEFLINNDFQTIMRLIKGKEFQQNRRKTILLKKDFNKTKSRLSFASKSKIFSENFDKNLNNESTKNTSNKCNIFNSKGNNIALLSQNTCIDAIKAKNAMTKNYTENQSSFKDKENNKPTQNDDKSYVETSPKKECLNVNETTSENAFTKKSVGFFQKNNCGETNVININELNYINNNINNNNNNIIINVGLFNESSSIENSLSDSSSDKSSNNNCNKNDTKKANDIVSAKTDKGQINEKNIIPILKNKSYLTTPENVRLVRNEDIMNSLNEDIPKVAFREDNSPPKIKKAGFVVNGDNIKSGRKKSILVKASPAKNRKTLLSRSRSELLEKFRQQVLNGPNLDLQKEETALNEKTLSLLNLNRSFMKVIENKLNNKNNKLSSLNEHAVIISDIKQKKNDEFKTASPNISTVKKEKTGLFKNLYNDPLFLSKNQKKSVFNMNVSSEFQKQYLEQLPSSSFEQPFPISQTPSPFTKIYSKVKENPKKVVIKQDFLIIQSTSKFQIIQEKMFKNLVITDSASLTIKNLPNNFAEKIHETEAKKTKKFESSKMKNEEYYKEIVNNKTVLKSTIEDIVKDVPIQKFLDMVTSSKHCSDYYNEDGKKTVQDKLQEDNKNLIINTVKNVKKDKKTIYNIKIGSKKLEKMLLMLQTLQDYGKR